MAPDLGIAHGSGFRDCHLTPLGQFIIFVTNQVAMTDPDAVQPGILHLVDAHLFKGTPSSQV